ncbi:MAG: hypothetical protein U0V74_16885 [Chitinophagales bacterium]
MDFVEASKTIIANHQNYIKSDEWDEDWEEYWVIFADLIGFASHCLLSTGITLNNIVRFHRAVNIALEGLPNIKKYQFTDACYILTKDSKTALRVACNIQNECHVLNHAHILEKKHVMFYQMIIPKIVLSKGKVLVIHNDNEAKNIERYAGISHKELLAGEGIVKAYYLEKRTTGGLVSVDPSFVLELKRHGCIYQKVKAKKIYKRWSSDKKNEIYAHDGVVDIPWLVVQPRQNIKGDLTLESDSTLKQKIESFAFIWKINFSEHMTESTPTDTLKHYGGALSHLCEVVQEYFGTGKARWDLMDLNKHMEKML